MPQGNQTLLAPPTQHTPDARRPVGSCPVCDGRRLHYAFSAQSHRVVRCADCRLMLLNPQPSDRELDAIYGDHYFIGHDDAAAGPGPLHAAELKAATARQYLRLLKRYRGDGAGTLLEVGCGHGDLLLEARRMGYQVTGVELAPAAADRAARRLRGAGDGTAGETVWCGLLEDLELPPGGFDVCILADVIEHARDPLALLTAVRRALRPGGVLLLATPSLDSWSARLLRRNWMEFKPEHLSYFDPQTIQTLLLRAGFRGLVVRPGWKVLSLDYVGGHFANYAVPVVGRLVRLAARLAPRRLRRLPVPVVASGMVVMARSDATPASQPVVPSRKLSIIVPAYNEAKTIGPVLDAVLAKRVPGVETEVIVVESNSTDGTREVVRRYASDPRVRVFFEDRPRGKGHAVRAGFEHATGDFILIQDGDLEYDLEDYDTLLEPLLSGREALVLGARHGGHAWWKMRQFNRQRLLSLFFNCGHWFFTTLLNALFGQRLKDPFTMYKVFRRDCLFGLEFRCDRFDFDHELLVKLIRKGYRPVEIPVNYRSRSFDEGKKVSTIRDPLTWVRALVRLRFTRIDPLAVVERGRKGRAASDSIAPAVLIPSPRSPAKAA